MARCNVVCIAVFIIEALHITMRRSLLRRMRANDAYLAILLESSIGALMHVTSMRQACESLGRVPRLDPAQVHHVLQQNVCPFTKALAWSSAIEATHLYWLGMYGISSSPPSERSRSARWGESGGSIDANTGNKHTI